MQETVHSHERKPEISALLQEKKSVQIPVLIRKENVNTRLFIFH